MTEAVGARIKRLRTAAGLSQRDISSPGISYAYVSRIEHGARTPSVKALRKLAERLGVTTEYLETGATDTLTDQLLRQVAGWADRDGIEVAVRDDGEGGVGVSVDYAREGGGERTALAASLTGALLELRAREEEVDRLLAERAEIEGRLEVARS